MHWDQRIAPQLDRDGTLRDETIERFDAFLAELPRRWSRTCAATMTRWKFVAQRRDLRRCAIVSTSSSLAA
jgi:hypothetical protein